MERSIQIRAMSCDTRLTILRLLADPKVHFSEQNVAEHGVSMSQIANAIGVAQPTASRHLEMLKHAGFITVKKHQKWSYVTKDNDAIREYLAWLRDEVGA